MVLVFPGPSKCELTLATLLGEYVTRQSAPRIPAANRAAFDRKWTTQQTERVTGFLSCLEAQFCHYHILRRQHE